MQNLNINGVIGSTFLSSTGMKLLVERELGDGLLHVVRLPSGTTHRVEDPSTGESTLPDTTWFEREIAEGMRKIADSDGPVTPARAAAQLLDRADILAKDPFAEARLVLMLGLIERGIEASDPRLGGEADRIWAGDLQQRFGDRPPNETVRSWYGRCGDSVVTLQHMMSMSGRVDRATRLDPEVEKIVGGERRRYWTNRGYKIVDVAAGIMARVETENNRRKVAGEKQLDMPGKETIRRRVNEMLCRDTYAEKYGEKAAKRKFDGSGRGISASRILKIAIMDDTVVDLVTCLDADRGLIAGRPYLCVLLDVHSRCVLGISISFEPPSVRTAAECVRGALDPMRVAMQCLRTANSPKTSIRPDRLARYPGLATINGKPATIITDNGKNFVAPGFAEMLLDLGISHELAPVGAPRHKGIVERFFRTFNTFLIDKLPGATLDPGILRKLGIDPSTEAIVTVGELRELVMEFLYLYHISHHSGIDAAPLAKWQASMAVHGRDMILDGRLIDIVTGVTVHAKRVTANGGVRMFGMTWKADDMRRRVIDPLAAREPHRKRLDNTTAVTTKIKYNPEDMLTIQTFVGDDWVPMTNTQPEYAAGLSLWQHEQIRDWAKRQSLKFNSVAERLAARDELNRLIRETFRDMDARERRAMARMAGRAVANAGNLPVEFVEAEPRHDGMGPIIPHDAPANEREDAQRQMSRPPAKSNAEDEDPAGSTEEGGNQEGSEDGDDHAPSIALAKPIVALNPPDEDDHNDEEYR